MMNRIDHGGPGRHASGPMAVRGANGRAAAAGTAMLLLVLAGCNRNDPPPPRTDAPVTSSAPAAPGVAPGTANPMADGRPVSAADAALTARVKAALLADPLVKGLSIDVDTSDGVVSLKGRVSGAAERAKAVEIARNVDGVRSVNDVLSMN